MLALRATARTARSLFVVGRTSSLLQTQSAGRFVGVSLRAFSSSSSSSDEELLTGSVKFYMRNKAYGFIIPDNGGEEIWVHRTSFDTPHSVEEFATRPYLYKDERVQFRIEPVHDRNHAKAVDLTFPDGQQVPLFRKNYSAAVVKGECGRLGQTVLDLMSTNNTDDDDDASLSDEELLSQIRQAVGATQKVITDAEQNQQQFAVPSSESSPSSTKDE